MGSFITHFRTLENELVAIPNSVIMQAAITNLSESSNQGGLKLLVPIGIGYDTEWQQVYRLLLGAAAKTKNIRTDPRPDVLQTSLDDFAVTYSLVVALDDPRQMRATRTALCENIQDAFNEAGLEIMTPSVRAVRSSLDPAIPEKYIDPPETPVPFRGEPEETS